MADGFGLGQWGDQVAESILDAGLKEAVPVDAEPVGDAMGFVEFLRAAGSAVECPDAPADVVVREEVEGLVGAAQCKVGRLPVAAELAEKGPAQREFLVLA